MLEIYTNYLIYGLFITWFFIYINLNDPSIYLFTNNK